MCAENSAECCPRFNPEPWEGKELRWQDRKFIKVRIRCLFHIPLNFGAAMARNVSLIERADALDPAMIVLFYENSLWGADLYMGVIKDVPGAQMATISGTFLSKVFEGPYKNIRSWIEEMKQYVSSQGKAIKKMYFYYTTCPKCAQIYGKNYVVLLAQI